MLQKYGVFLILVAAITPLPWSAISMLVGSLHYPSKKYLLWALARFIRFAVYAAIIWEANIVL
jgi:membrane protein YqaA with SNARE-associated domain